METTPPIPAAMPPQRRREPYEAALLEYDLSKLPARIEAALEAIHQRLIERRETATWGERDEIEDALRTLFTLRQRRAAALECANHAARFRIFRFRRSGRGDCQAMHPARIHRSQVAMTLLLHQKV